MNRPDASVAPGAVIGDRVTLGKNVRIGEGAVLTGDCSIGADCVIGAGVVLDPGISGTITLERGSILMAAATIAAPVTVGCDAVIQPGSVVTRNVPPHAVVSGNPAQIVGYTTVSDGRNAKAPRGLPTAGRQPSQVQGVALHRLPKVLDLRGNLTVGEFERTIPFAAKRYFMVFGVPNAEIRGEHAHRRCHQFLICAHGACSVVADDGTTREEFLLDDPTLGLHLPPLTWGIQYKYTPDALLLVFASEFYDADEYIRDYAEFQALASART